jgi:hypothetical protein
MILILCIVIAGAKHLEKPVVLFAERAEWRGICRMDIELPCGVIFYIGFDEKKRGSTYKYYLVIIRYNYNIFHRMIFSYVGFVDILVVSARCDPI